MSVGDAAKRMCAVVCCRPEKLFVLGQKAGSPSNAHSQSLESLLLMASEWVCRVQRIVLNKQYYNMFHVAVGIA